MHLPKTRTILAVLAVSLFFGFFRPGSALAASTPTLGAAESYAVLSGTYTNVAVGTTISGDVGFTTAPAMVPAGIHINYGAGAPTPAARIDGGTALLALDTQLCTFNFAPGAIDLSTDVTHGPVGVYTPGVYCSTGAMNISAGMTLTGGGTYIFRPVGALTTTVGSIITLLGASACDVFWTPTAATTLAANTTFFGTIIDNANAITLGANTIWTGRALSLGAGTVTTDTNTITVPVCTATLTVTKIVINDDGRTKVIGDFPLFVSGVPVVSGVTKVFVPGVYMVTESTDMSYTQSFTGDCTLLGSVTLAPGDAKFCIMTNNDVPTPTAPTGGGGGGGYSSPTPSTPVAPLIDVVKTPNPLALPNGPGPVTYTYTLRNIGTVVVSDITLVGDTCSPILLQSGDTNGDGKLDLNEVWVHTCTTTLTQTHTNTVVATGWANNISTVDIARATVEVGVPVVTPAIHVIKIPRPFTVPTTGGWVTYTEIINNTGTIPLVDIRLIDDKCRPVKYRNGDTNRDGKLDLNERWVYTCRAFLTSTTTNTVFASGTGNGITVRDLAVATVVATPVIQLPPVPVVPSTPVITPTPIVDPTPVPVITTPIVTTPIVVVPKLPKTGVTPEKKVSNLPVNIRIPDIGVSAVIRQVGLTKEGFMDVPSDYRDAGWYTNGAIPGEVGSAVMDGHLNWFHNAHGVFADLQKLVPGNKILIEDEGGNVISFVVRESKRYLASDEATEVFNAKDDKAHLNLITCDGSWDTVAKQYAERLVVFAERE